MVIQREEFHFKQVCLQSKAMTEVEVAVPNLSAPSVEELIEGVTLSSSEIYIGSEPIILSWTFYLALIGTAGIWS